MIATEGGPGYPASGSADDYVALFGPLLRTRGLLLVDNRGTGDSAPIDCPSLETFRGRTDDAAFARRVGRCAQTIDARYAGRVSAGTHPANLFATAYAADDIAAIARALHTGRVDLYGDSYGTWLAQSVAARHPALLHSVVLDSAYPVRGLDPFYRSSGVAARSALNAVCFRDPACRTATAGDHSTPVSRLGRLLARLRTGPPLRGTITDRAGRPITRVVQVRTLADLAQDAALEATVDRDLDAAVRAALTGDAVPLLRLAVEHDDRDDSDSGAQSFSDGLYFAVSCADYPQLFGMGTSTTTRARALRRRLDDNRTSAAFSPFRVGEWLTMSAYAEAYRACLYWPPVAQRPQAVPSRSAPLPARVPLLVIGGDLDSLTPLRDAGRFAPGVARRFRVVALRNTVHVVSEGNNVLRAGTACGRRIIRAFVTAPARLATLDTRCAARIPPLRTPGSYPLRLADAPQARVVGGPDPGPVVRRTVTVAAAALADAVTRRVALGIAGGPGLRGGRFVTHGHPASKVQLTRSRFVTDVAVDGEARIAGEAVKGTLTAHLADGTRIRVALSWSAAGPDASATVGRTRLRFPAP